MAVPARTIWTVGHSNLPIAAFLRILQDAGIETLVDLRSYPSSRYCPQFNQTNLMHSLANADINYTWLQSLGGRRHNKSSGLNDGWKNQSFRSYADYTLTVPWKQGMRLLCQTAQAHRCAYMCSEAEPWRCHRTIVSDALVARGWTVLHLPSGRKHSLGDWGAKPMVSDGHVTYPAQQQQLSLQ